MPRVAEKQAIDLDALAERLAAAAPPLTEEQRRALRPLLAPRTGSAAALHPVRKVTKS